MVDNVEKLRPSIIPLITYYREDLNNPTGGGCHIVLADGNLSDKNLSYCQQFCERYCDDVGYLIATILRTFTFSEREYMYDRDWKNGLLGNEEDERFYQTRQDNN